MSRLDYMQWLTAAMTGVMREMKHRTAGDQHAWGEPSAGGWEGHIEGACAEKGASLDLGLPWNDTAQDGGADVGPYHIRQTSHPNGRLRLHPRDCDEDVFILSVGRSPRNVLIGWCYGREGKLKEYWEDPTGANRWAFFVPREFPPMRQIAELSELTKEKVT